MSRSVHTFVLALALGGLGLGGCVAEPGGSDESAAGIDEVSEAVELDTDDAVVLDGDREQERQAVRLIRALYAEAEPTAEPRALEVEPLDSAVPTLPGGNVMGPEPEPWDGCYGPGCIHRFADAAQGNPSPETPTDPDVH